MRLWSIHPRYLDAKGLVALWREGLLARSVLAGNTSSYLNHPQLQRFKAQPRPLDTLDAYLSAVFDEARRRDYSFDKNKITHRTIQSRLPIQQGQIQFEWGHLQKKLRRRNPKHLENLRNVSNPESHPLFVITSGGIESWERL